MQIIKKRLKKSLSNKIFKNQLTPYTILYTVIDQSQTITKEFPKKTITKILLNNNFKVLKKTSFIHPLSYISGSNVLELLSIYNKLKQHKDFNKILICNIKLKSLLFKNINLIKNFHLTNPIQIFTKLIVLLHPLLKTFLFLKKKKKIE